MCDVALQYSPESKLNNGDIGLPALFYLEQYNISPWLNRSLVVDADVLDVYATDDRIRFMRVLGEIVMSVQNIIRGFTATLLLVSLSSQAQQSSDDAGSSSTLTKTSDISYAMAADRDLHLDLYMPDGIANPPLIVYVHGGAWRGGSKAEPPIAPLVADGYAMASLDFHLSGEAMFPAQIHDIKAAIRFLRGNAERYGYDATKVGILGSSSGGHLVALMGVSNGHESLEGTLGDYLEESSDVQAVVSYYGASNLTSILNQSTPLGLRVRIPALDLLIGGQPEDVNEMAKLASPVFHVDANSAPLLMLHGDQDPQMPINQSHELHNAYKQNNLFVQFEVVHGAAHGGAVFYDANSNALVKSFLDQQLR